MSRATAEPDDARLHARTGAFPWLLSSTVHSLLCVMMVLSWEPGPRNASPGGNGLEVTVLSSGSGEYGDGDTRGDGQGLSDTPVELDAPPAGGYFEEDGPAIAAAQASSSGSGRGSSSAALRDLLNAEPLVKPHEVLPAGSSPGGSARGPEASLASADRLTGQPGGSRRLRGGRALTGVFGLKGEGYKFVYVFDRSGSMDGHGGAPLAAAKSELVASLQNLDSTHQFQIIFYNEEPRIFSPGGNPGRLVFGTDQNKNLARRFVGSITASGATRHVEAMLMALRLNPDVIFFLTDADEPQITPPELARIAQMNEGTAINTIEFGTMTRSDSDNFLVKLARQNGGQHVFVDLKRLEARSGGAD